MEGWVQVESLALAEHGVIPALGELGQEDWKNLHNLKQSERYSKSKLPGQLNKTLAQNKELKQGWLGSSHLQSSTHWGQVDFHEFKESPGYIASFKPA